MTKIKGHAGHNIRLLAFSRRFKALYCFVGAGFVVYLPFIFAKFTAEILHPLADANSDSARSLALPPIIYGAASLCAICLIANGVFLWKRANHAAQGAKGEEEIADVLRPLVESGWQIEYGKRLGKSRGDIDIICVSPKNKAYVIDVKSHRGIVFTDGKKLCRRIGKKQSAFEKDFLAQVTKQALGVKRYSGAGFVTPILVFANANVSIATGRIKHVYVVEKVRLLSLLRSLG